MLSDIKFLPSYDSSSVIDFVQKIKNNLNLAYSFSDPISTLPK